MFGRQVNKQTTRKEVQSQEIHFNPVSKIQKLLRKKQKPQESKQNNLNVLNTAHTQSNKSISFKDLSKEKYNYWQTQAQKPAKNILGNPNDDSLLNFSKVRRKLNFGDEKGNSKEKVVTFSEIVRNSRQKSIKQKNGHNIYTKRENITNLSREKSERVVKSFTNIKNKLIKAPEGKQVQIQIRQKSNNECKVEQMVMISMSHETWSKLISQQQYSEQLTMQPHL